MLYKSIEKRKELSIMMRNYFWPGIGIGAVAGTLIGIRLKSEEKQVKRSMNKAKRNMENLFDSIGM